MHRNEVLYAALAKIKAMQAANYQPRLRLDLKLREGKAMPVYKRAW